ncbi:tyrosine-type recombinase/integrase [Streptosporangium sp. NPDC087985]|uniref:tyrosine-type recombinase/integrase n=1 Tax=Streptosporangium sp. NPDC087985 TaxID=3366196 RepID=UPI0038058E84
MSENTVVPFARPARGRRTRRAKPVTTGTPLDALLDSWQLALAASNKAAYTITLYTRTARAFIAHLQEHDLPCDAEGVEAEHVRGFLVAEQARTSVHTSAAHHRYLSVWFNWMIEDGERSTFSPVLKADRPHVPKKAKKYLTDDELGRLLAACKGNGFLERRDAAMIRVFIDNGVRVSGLAGLLLADVDLRGKRLRITLKGGDEHWVPIGSKTVAALDRYLRARSQHRCADSPSLWVGTRPGFTRWGVDDVLRKRGLQAGIENVTAHRFRGTAAHQLLRAGASVDDVQSILGWKSPDMVRHYTGELAHERARETHARLSPGDRI